MYVKTLQIVLQDTCAKMVIVFQVTFLRCLFDFILFHSNIRLSITLDNNILDVCKDHADCPEGTICKNDQCVKGNYFEVDVPFMLIRTIIRIEVML